MSQIEMSSNVTPYLIRKIKLQKQIRMNQDQSIPALPLFQLVELFLIVYS